MKRSMEERKSGGMEGWKIGRMEEGKSGRRAGSPRAVSHRLALAVTNSRSKLADERGQSLLAPAILWAFALTLIIGLVFDLGAVAIAQVRAQDAADLAVQEAAKTLDLSNFGAGQEIVLSSAAVGRARSCLAEYSNGHVTLTRLVLYQPDARHWALQLDGEIHIKMRFLSWVGIDEVERRVHAQAVPAFGAESEGD